MKRRIMHGRRRRRSAFKFGAVNLSAGRRITDFVRELMEKRKRKMEKGKEVRKRDTEGNYGALQNVNPDDV
tara:strand:+ start:555 stop:767 length:213 start_codon:yes stop_codon:yes gene_type:complete